MKETLLAHYWSNKTSNRTVVNNIHGKIISRRISIENKDIQYFNKVVNNNALSRLSVFSAIYSFLLRRFFEDYDNIITCYHSDAGFLALEAEQENSSFKEYLLAVSKELQATVAHAGYQQARPALDQYSHYGISVNDALMETDKCQGLLLGCRNELDELRLTVHWNDGLIQGEIITDFLACFTTLLINFETILPARLSDINYLTKEQSGRVIESFNNTRAEYADGKTIVELFEEQVARTPENVAVIFGDVAMTYQQLNELANQLGHYLRHTYHIQADDRIGLKLERSECMILAVWGILKAGAAYVPIDPNYPLERINYIEKDADCKLIVDEAVLAAFYAQREHYDKTNPEKINTSNSLVYVIYTSGTTGQPKGVMIEHTSLVNRLAWMQKAYALESTDTLLQKTTYSFDVSVWELIWWGLFGARISVPPPGAEKEPAMLIAAIFQDNVTVLHFVPSMLSVFLEYFQQNTGEKQRLRSLKQVFVSGEALTNHQCALFKELLPEVALMNLYGPTEAAIDVSYYDCAQEHATVSVPIGKPIDNIRLYILDAALKPVPVGVSGRIYISGVGVARGYLNKKALTDEKFITDPFTGQRMYDTGDQGRWLPDGNIEYLGRKDQQVKIRGYRIETGEIENAVNRYSGAIRQVLVDVREINKERALVAYFTAEGEIDKHALRQYLFQQLPEYMVPAFFSQLDRMPLTPNGKIDRKGLPDLGANDLLRKTYIAPETILERQLAGIWQDVLGIEKIGTTDDFFELGGHSLMIVQITNRIYKELSATITFKDFFATPTIAAIAGKLRSGQFSVIQKAPEMKSYPLTPSQQRIWVVSQLDDGAQAYNITGAVHLKGELNKAAFVQALDSLIKRHEILHTCFRSDTETGELSQCIIPTENIYFNIADSHFNIAASQPDQIETYLDEIAHHAFDLENGPLIKTMLIQSSPQEYVFGLSMHHIISDGWTVELIISEIVETYNALVANKPLLLPQLSIQYKDFAVWLKEEMRKVEYVAAEQYWLSQFSDELPVLQLPGFKKRPLIQTYKGRSVSKKLSRPFIQQLHRFSKEQGATSFFTLVAGINALLYRYTGQEDIIVGTPVAGRQHPDLEHQLGLFLNTLALRTRLSGRTSFTELLAQEKAILLGAYEHQLYPFDELIGKLRLEKDLSQPALFNVMVVLQNQEQLHLGAKKESLYGLEIAPYNYNRKSAQFDVSFVFSEDGNGDMELRIEYNTDIYEDFLIERMFAHFEHLLAPLMQDPSLSLAEIPLLTAEERQQLDVFNDTDFNFEDNYTITGLFETVVEMNTTQAAVVFEGKVLTYQELNEGANQLAVYLRNSYGVKPDELIAMKLKRSERALITILGIMKAGAGYVPLDPAYPEERIAYITSDTQAKVLIDETFFERFWDERHQYAGTNIPAVHESGHIAYIIYTSGTTGVPKGVMVTHRNVVNLIKFQTDHFGMNAAEKILQFSNYTFDASVEQIFLALLNGAVLHILPEDAILDETRLSAYIRENGITHFHAIPSIVARVKPDKNFALKRVIAGGDVCPVEVAASWSKHCDFYNEYGPTETTITAIEQRFDEKQPFAIGRPVGNTQVYILNEALQLTPLGVAGRIYISGEGVTRGYLNKSELSSKHFLEDPFKSSGKMYHTGDLGRWLPNGDVEFLGRHDLQVKIRGYRIELEEIESLLYAFSGSIQQVVADVKLFQGEKALVVYYVAAQEIDAAALRAFLLSSLPEYMVPSFYVPLKEIPLTANGKVDRKNLPAIGEENNTRSKYIAPRNEVEQQLADIWGEVLGIEQVGIHDNFFELGGSSLMISKLINRISQRLSVELSFRTFFAAPTVEALSGKLVKGSAVVIPKAPAMTSYPLTASQHRLWILSQMDGASVAYNMPAVVKLQGEVDVVQLEAALKKAVKRHEILRTCFRMDDISGEVRQFILPAERVALAIEQCALNETQAEAYLHQLNHELFDLENGPLIRAALICTDANEYLFFFSQHHIIGDAWSTQLLTREIIAGYNNSLELPVLDIQFKDYAVWHDNIVRSGVYDQSEKYWLSQFAGEIPVLNLPALSQRPLIQTFNGETVSHHFSADFSQRLRAFSTQHGVTLFMTLMAGVKALLHQHTGQEDMIVGTPIAGRNNPVLEHQLGFYLNTLAIRTRLSSQMSFSALLQLEKDTLIAAYEHQHYPFDKLIDLLQLKRDTSRSALFDVMVVLQDLPVNTAGLDNIQVKPFRFRRKTSQFDMSFIFIGEDALTLNIEYACDLYDRFLIERMIPHLENLLEAVMEQPDLHIGKINILSAEERHEVIHSFNTTAIDFGPKTTVTALFEQTVVENQNKIAVVFEDRQLTYRELNAVANQLANYLRDSYQLQADDLVAIKLERGDKMLMAILGVLKAGAAYVPVDINYPEERIKYILEDTQAKVVIDERELTRFFAQQERYDVADLVSDVSPDNLVYVIYTSGTTGNPKGVMMPHGAILNLLLYHNDAIGDNERTLQLANTSFDVSFQEIFTTLLSGATLYPISDDVKKDIGALTGFITDNAISTLFLPTAYFKVLIESPAFLNGITDKLRNVIVAGEQLVLNDAIFGKLKQYPFIIHNHYGPAETHVVTTYCIDKTSEEEIIPPIGRPIANTQIYILGEGMTPLPSCVTGRVYIGGANLAKGYLNKSAETKAKFIDNPFLAGGRIYDTGDMGRWLPDGTLEFYGRKDHQVKIRGYRVELVEVEKALSTYAAEIRHVIVLVKEARGEKMLVAYYVADRELDKRELSAYLKGKLPEFMVPAFYIALDHIPLTPNGKLDRRALPEVVLDDIAGRTYVAPTTNIERDLVRIWQDILGIEQVGITDNFFELGGHSLKAIAATNKIHATFKVKVSLSAFFSSPTPEQQARLIQHSVKQVSLPLIPPLNTGIYYDLSPFQLRLWLTNKLAEKSSYNVFGNFRLKAAVDLPELKSALLDIIGRHEILRTVFVEEDGFPKQKVLDLKEVDFEIGYEQHIKPSLLDELFDTAFDLSIFPLFKVVAVKTPAGTHMLLLIHHIICDGWSLEKFALELNDILSGVKPTSQPLQYKDFAHWTNRNIADGLYEPQLVYWKGKLGNHFPHLKLPYDHRGSERDAPARAMQVEVLIDNTLEKDINAFIRSNKISFIAFFIASVKVLIQRVTGVNDIAIGLPVANREQEQVKGMIGYFVNTIIHRDIVDPAAGYLQFLSAVNTTLLEGLDNQALPFEKVIEALSIKAEPGRFPITSVFINGLDFNSDDIDFSSLANNLDYFPPSAVAKFDIEFFIKKCKDGIVINCTYREAFYKEETIRYWLEGLMTVIRQVLLSPDIELGDLEVFDKYLNKPVYPTPTNAFDAWPSATLEETLVERLREITDKYRENKAIVQQGKTLTYRELDHITNGISASINSCRKEAHPSNVVLVLEHGIFGITGVIGTLKSGNAYVPIDIHLPLERMIDSIESLDFEVILCNTTTRHIADKIAAEFTGIQVLNIEDMAPLAEAPQIPVSATQPAYILFTSGSTGKPKGVMQNHRNVLHFMEVFTQRLHISERDRVSLLPYYNFDSSVMDIFGALLNGAALYPYDINAEGIEPLKDWILSNRISIYHSVPTIYRRFTGLLTGEERFEHLRLVVLGGEAVFQEDFNVFVRHFESNAILINGYGPTESTITLQNFLNKDSIVSNNKISIGYPVPRTEVYLLKQNGKKARIYEEGEIIYKSEYLALGYYKHEQLTTEKFVKDPFTNKDRVYFSGDLGRMLPSGEIEFVGRNDNQIKFNGIRIELDEIDLGLLHIPEIAEAVTVLKASGESNLIVSYVKLKHELRKSAVIDALKQRLPAYMIPHAIVYLDTFPLTNTNKIDRKALPDVTEDDLVRREYIAPVNEIERKLVAIWENVLGLEQVGVEDSFFELGGHSLIAIQLVNRIQHAFNVKFSLKDIYSHPTVKDAARLVQGDGVVPFESIKTVEQKEYYAVSNSQKRMWLASLRKEHKHLYNLPSRYQIRGPLDVAQLNAAFMQLIKKHETLRTNFRFRKDDVYQFVNAADEVSFEIALLENPADVDVIVKRAALYPFDLERELPVRVALLKIASNEHILLLTLHHMISDGWSTDIIMKDLLDFYNNTANDIQLDVQYKDYVYWHKQRYASQELFWRDFLREPMALLTFPTDFPRPKILSHEGRVINTVIEGSLFDDLKMELEKRRINKTDYFLGIYGLLLNSYTGQDEFLIGTVASGRTHIDLEKIVGVFINYLPLRIDIRRDLTLQEYLLRQGQEFLQVYENQDYPFDVMIDKFVSHQDNSRNPLFDTTIILHNKENVSASKTLGAGTEISEYVIKDDLMGVSALDFKFDIIFRKTDILIRMEYNTNLFLHATMEALINKYVALLTGSIDKLETQLQDLIEDTSKSNSYAATNNIQEIII